MILLPELQSFLHNYLLYDKNIHLDKIDPYMTNGLMVRGKEEISKIVNLRLNHVSMTLSELKECGLVECVNDDSKRGRLYKIKSLGEKTLSWLNENV